MKEITEKTCSSCGTTQPIDHFYKDSRYKDGRMCYCKKCRKDKVKQFTKAYLEINGFSYYNPTHKKDIKRLNKIDKVLGGYNIHIPNYVKEGEYKFNIIPTRGKPFCTNTFTDFIDYLYKNLGTKA